jgi:hypothetical protein
MLHSGERVLNCGVRGLHYGVTGSTVVKAFSTVL